MTEAPKPPEGYRIIQVEGQPYLEADQNFIDQRPFLDIPEIIGSDFFKDPESLAGIAAFVRFVMVTDKRRYKDRELVRPIRKYILNDLQTRVFQAWNDVTQFIADTPYLEQYIKYYWLRERKKGRLFDEHGEPIPGTTEEAESFVRFQTRMIKVDKALSYLGLEEESPGLATPDGVRAAIDETRGSQPNRYWRLVTKSEALR